MIGQRAPHMAKWSHASTYLSLHSIRLNQGRMLDQASNAVEDKDATDLSSALPSFIVAEPQISERQSYAEAPFFVL